ncbi:MAG TPA: TauD/TfdA family dioxygenase, partial [Hyphomicrobiaceae bacterium]|nr:TauD/TfdA family dioxygenase [Hyphomicrobiaceae bacterium]
MAQDTATLRAIDDLPAPVQGAAVWYGPDMAQRTDWVHALTDEDVAEVERAMRPLAAAAGDIAAITKRDFPLPGLAPKLAAICAEVIDGRGFVLMRGLPVERWSIRESATAYFGIGSHIGRARSQNAKGHVLGHVRDLGRNAAQDPTARVYQTRERQTYHTDSCDIVGLLCLKTAKSGGASALVSSMTIYNEMLKRRPDLLVHLFQPLHTDRRGEVPAGQKPWHDIPVYNWHEGRLSALYSRRYIESARRFPEVPALTPQQIEALDVFDALAEDPAINMQMTFRPGDMQWVHNHTMLHDR